MALNGDGIEHPVRGYDHHADDSDDFLHTGGEYRMIMNMADSGKIEKDIMRRLHAPCGELIRRDEENDFCLDIGGLICRLLLFDTYVLDSNHLLEIPHIVRLFGCGGFTELLKAGILEFDSSVRGICVPDSTPPDEPSTHPGFHNVCLFGFRDPKMMTSEDISSVLQRLDLHGKDRERIRVAIRKVLHPLSAEAGTKGAKQLESDLLRGSGEVRLAVRMAVKRKFNIEAGDFELQFDLDKRGVYRHVTNLGQVHNLDKHQVHDIIEKAIIAVGGMETRVEEMETLQAMAGFTGEDLPLFEAKLGILYRARLPEKGEGAFHRVMDIAGIPVVPEGANIKIDAVKLLKIRESAEHREFISWLPKVAMMSDKEIRDAVASFGARASTLIHGPMGQAARFLAVKGIGVIPVVGTALGATVGALDTFLLKRLIPYSGLAAFVNRQYPSLFE